MLEQSFCSTQKMEFLKVIETHRYRFNNARVQDSRSFNFFLLRSRKTFLWKILGSVKYYEICIYCWGTHKMAKQLSCLFYNRAWSLDGIQNFWRTFFFLCSPPIDVIKQGLRVLSLFWRTINSRVHTKMGKKESNNNIFLTLIVCENKKQ